MLVALLAVEYFAPRWSVRAALFAMLALAIGAVLAAWWLSSLELAVASGLTALSAGLILAARTKLAQYAIGLLTRPVAVTAVLLIACLGLAAYCNIVTRMPPSAVDLPLSVGSSYHSIDGLVGLTDRGQALPLIAYDEGDNLTAAELQYLDSERFVHQVIRLHSPSTACNCHGWVYTGGRFAIQSRYIDALLADNDYAPVEKPRAEDLVIYRGPQGTVEHSGLVRMVGKDGLILVESKWGPLGVYLHPVDAQPYGTTRSFYRSRRAGHVVTIVPKTSVPEEKLPALAGLPPHDLSEIDASASARQVKPTEAKVYERPILRIPGHRDG